MWRHQLIADLSLVLSHRSVVRVPVPVMEAGRDG
jgi:hypothetical protein